MNYKLSIITINYNNIEGLIRTFNSIKNQKNSEFEYIVIDGGSNDGSKEIIEDNKIIIDYWISEKDNGIYNALNKGIKKAKGKYCLFVNSGDILMSEYSISYLHQIMTKIDDDSSLIFLDCLKVNNDMTLEMLVSSDKKFLSDLCLKYFSYPSTIFKKNIFYDVGFFSEDYKIVSDFLFYMTSLLKHNIKAETYPFCLSVFYADGVSSQNSLMHKNEATKVFSIFYKNWQLKLFSGRSFKFLKKTIIHKLIVIIGIDRKINIVNKNVFI